MKNNFDRQILIIKEFEDLCKQDKPISVTVFNLSAGEVDVDETASQIEEAININPIDGYEILEKRYKHQHGAGGASQEIILALMVGLGSNAMTEVIKFVWRWAKAKIYSNKESKPINIENHLQEIQNIISQYFSETKKIKFLEVNNEDDLIKAKIKDNKRNKYYVELHPDGEIIKIKKI